MNKFTIRVYGICIQRFADGSMLLVSDEIIKGRRITKFPGGGLEFGEGLKECLVREIREELNAEAIDLEHYYTTDFFQQSTFHSDPMQVISVYYKFKIVDHEALELLPAPFAFPDPQEQEGCRWIAMETVGEETFDLPIDKYVIRKLKKAIVL